MTEDIPSYLAHGLISLQNEATGPTTALRFLIRPKSIHGWDFPVFLKSDPSIESE